MTQKDKCDVCRHRKVKCDEQRPICGQCKKKNRPCAYEYSHTSRFAKVRTNESGTDPTYLTIHDTRDGRIISMKAGPEPSEGMAKALMIRSIKEAGSGDGVFYTFRTVLKARHRNPSSRGLSYMRKVGVPRPLVSREVYLCAEFSDMLGEKNFDWTSTFLWGGWISSVPGRLGVNPALDDAADCFVSANVAYYSKKGIGDTSASKKYNAAIVSLQKVLDADDHMRFATETLAAVNLLLLFEEVLDFGQLRWQSHYRGLIQLLLARGPQVKADDMSRSLFYAALNHDFSESIWGGSQSTFDSSEWLNLPPPENPEKECEDFTCISREISRQMIQVPRLTILVRRVCENPFDVDAGIEALALAEHLYCSYSDIITPRIVAALSKRATWVETLDKDLARYCPQSLEFQWYNIFEGLVRCYCVRILVCSLCTTLRSTFPFSRILQTADLEEEEAHCARLIAASAQYAEKQDTPPVGPLIMRMPLQVSYGTWWRRREHDALKDVQVEKRAEAIVMEEWCVRKLNEFIKVLNGDAISKSKLQRMYMAAAGGGPCVCRKT
ncbi:hypothetical protein DPSP01_003778 [Paraphaeosphaeria sporulosa]|uniref:Zn(2)-C6 fungal-type domain-containing protein n=1 Tax=Paraphaeosphaeria sporulosa TaxID=1460663 RepID=A0A177CRN8_9PLEO|nr:uncharacterized protein CC84DRAFT_1160979 [Paraphaeosphaeria sporulosa]OAG09956.1 hypothetical protein CC84DRAFT_1160979 [Paraphaeosphaeria sporulosa]